jgi:hypothetical protein
MRDDERSPEMNAETPTLDLDEATEETTPCCECCGEDCPAEDLIDDGGYLICPACRLSNATDEARDAVEVAEGEVESIESEMVDRKAEYEQALEDLREQFEADMVDLRERLREEKKGLAAARKRLAKLEA